jgi:glycosyltransferase involved in cell wall biosynthesis
VVVCTRDRPTTLRATLEALARQTDQGFEVVVVNQGQSLSREDLELAGVARPRVLADRVGGLSRARNLAASSTDADWLVLVDDDCTLEPDWIFAFKRIVAQRSRCCLVAGEVVPDRCPPVPYLACGVIRIRRERYRSGRWRRPLSVGGGAGLAVRRATVCELGGWDERLGAGAPRFPAAEDEDFNYRLLRAGGIAFVTPALRTNHLQWRQPHELAPLFRDYMMGRGGSAIKQLRCRDPAGGAWLLALAVVDCLILLASGARFGPRSRLPIALASCQGLLIGVVRGLRTTW